MKKKCKRRVWPLLNPMTVATNNATALTAEEKDRLLAPPRAAFASLRQGTATERKWLELATCCQVALCIEDGCVVRGLRQQLNEADQVLGTIHARATATGSWLAPTLYSHEIISVSTMLMLFAFQVDKLSAGEFRAATALAIAHQRERGGKVLQANGEAAC